MSLRLSLRETNSAREGWPSHQRVGDVCGTLIERAAACTRLNWPVQLWEDPDGNMTNRWKSWIRLNYAALKNLLCRSWLSRVWQGSKMDSRLAETTEFYNRFARGPEKDFPRAQFSWLISVLMTQARLRLEQRLLRSKDGIGIWKTSDSGWIISVICAES